MWNNNNPVYFFENNNNNNNNNKSLTRFRIRSEFILLRSKLRDIKILSNYGIFVHAIFFRRIFTFLKKKCLFFVLSGNLIFKEIGRTSYTTEGKWRTCRLLFSLSVYTFLSCDSRTSVKINNTEKPKWNCALSLRHLRELTTLTAEHTDNEVLEQFRNRYGYYYFQFNTNVRLNNVCHIFGYDLLREFSIKY